MVLNIHSFKTLPFLPGTSESQATLKRPGLQYPFFNEGVNITEEIQDTELLRTPAK